MDAREDGIELPEPHAAPPPEARPARLAPRHGARSTVEFLLVLLIGILLVRGFSAEAYIVPTGSMAPTLLGLHREYVCPNCGHRFDLGMDELGRSGRSVCPNNDSTSRCGRRLLLRDSNGSGSIARITAPQHCCPLHLNEQTPQDGLNATLSGSFAASCTGA